MNQHVEVTVRLNLWMPAKLSADEIVTSVRAALPVGFGEMMTAMQNPVDILRVREEREIYRRRAARPKGARGR